MKFSVLFLLLAVMPVVALLGTYWVLSSSEPTSTSVLAFEGAIIFTILCVYAYLLYATKDNE